VQPPKFTVIDGGAHRGSDASSAPPATPQPLPADDTAHHLRVIEALLFAASEPLDETKLAASLASKSNIKALLADLQGQYAQRGVNLVQIGGRWAFRTASDLGYLLQRHALEERKLSKAALETLSIIAYHQPVTRAEIEDVRGVSTSKGTLDVLMETGWVRPRGRRRAPGKPITYGTTPQFLDHFGLAAIRDLPGLAELKGAGLLDANLPPDFRVPEPTDVAALMPDELPLEAGDDADTHLELQFDLEAEPSSSAPD
jgi:segregation and condensation protein B